MFINRNTRREPGGGISCLTSLLQSITKFLFVLTILVYCSVTRADVLLTGTAIDGNDAEVDFSLSGDSREEVVGGEIRFGNSSFEITHVSVHRLVGAEGNPGRINEYAVFSSSYTEQTATGQPWIAADSYVHCDKQYNSFLAVYHVSKDKAKELQEPPFQNLTESTDYSDTSTVYCFVSAPGNIKADDK